MAKQIGWVLRPCVVAGVLAISLSLWTSRLDAQISQSLFRAADGTAYQVIRLDLSAGLDHVRVTSLGGSVDGIGGCNLSQGMSGGNASAVAGCDSSGEPPSIQDRPNRYSVPPPTAR